MLTDHKQHLSPSRQRLVELMQETNFGRIEGLVVRNGEPVLDPAPRITRDILFGKNKDNGVHTARAKADFVLKDEHTQLFRFFEVKRSLTIETLIIQHGLPARMTLRQSI
jgi:hypothetical protein